MWNITVKRCIAHLNQVTLSFGSFTIPSLSLYFLLLRAVLTDLFLTLFSGGKKTKLNKKINKKKLCLFHAHLKASG